MMSKALALTFAYTVDGGAESEIEYENFNAVRANVDFKGFNIHPGSAKNTMINAALVAMEFDRMLPAGETPRDTEGYEGFLSSDPHERKCGESKPQLYFKRP